MEDGLVIYVFDDALDNPKGYRETALRHVFEDVPVGPAIFRGIAKCTSPELPNAIRKRLPLDVKTTFFRKSPLGQPEPNFIHSDTDMGEWTAVYYMNPDPPVGDGTTFWRRDGSISGQWTPGAAVSALELDSWEPWRHVEARFNRLLVFRADLFHSRGIVENYGERDGARLIQVAFCAGA